MRIKGEQVLDKAIYFTKKHLLGALEHLESPFVEEVSSALLTPPFRRVRILEARSYIPCYEKEATRNEAILELAKLNFNILQLHFCEELKEVTLWWQKLSVGSNLSFIRDRIVETYFWINGTSYNRKYSYSRIIATKITAFMTIIDDILDTYGSTEESMQIVEAINRWDEGAIDVLPEYMKDIYLYLLETFHSFEEHLGPEKSYRVVYLKESASIICYHRKLKLVQAYNAELKWRDEKYVPKKISEHLEVSTISIGTSVVACAFLREQLGIHCASTIQSYMKEHETTKDDACKEIKELIENSWKDILKHYLELIDQPMVVPQIILDLSRTVDNMYKHTDAYTNLETIKDTIRMLFVDPVE
ncbi:hypothetical protein CFC21_034439 [Triticum aestivum]|uniref:Terpene synthase metal-binding domain-containing protein n=2 Tax=Triticum aestivum TaxID=4565 RepID=A0A9R1F3P0_WHEAT|nr:hypothetical protein CFC21_034439 [Triticum aestivum]